MGYIDIHSHILPGVDDGSKSMEESLGMLKIAAQNQIDRVIVTPHNKAERRNVSVEGIHKRIHVLQEAMKEEGISIRLYSGMEIFYREGVAELLEEGRLCTLAGTRYVLVEFLPVEQFSYIRAAVDELAGNEYIPVIAHAERYECMASHLSNMDYVIERGALIQVNASSITGGMGWKIKQSVKKMLKEQMIHFLGTDAHDERKRIPQLSPCADYLYRKCSREYADALLWGNAEKMLDGVNL